MVRKILLALIFGLAVIATGASAHSQDQAKEIDAAKKTGEAFLSAMQKADRAGAIALVAANAQDEFAGRFGGDSKRLKSAAPLRFIFAAPLKNHSLDPIEYEANLLYAVKNDGEWTTVALRLYRFGKDAYRVEYWRIDDSEPNILAMSDDPALQNLPAMMRWMALGLAFGGLLLIGFIIWLARRRPHIVAPESIAEKRTAAVTRRDGDS